MLMIRGLVVAGWMLIFICFVTAVKITQNNLRRLLTDQEWRHIFGSSETVPDFTVVYPKHSRHRRSLLDRHLELPAPAFRRRFSLILTPSPALTTPEFRLVATWSNRSEELPTEEVSTECYYRGENSALSLCDGVRGIVSNGNNEYFIIHPLPSRLQKEENQPHILIRRPSSYPFSTPQTTPLENLNPICAHEETNPRHSSKKYYTKHRRKSHENGNETDENYSENERDRTREQYEEDDKNYEETKHKKKYFGVNEKKNKLNTTWRSNNEKFRLKRAVLMPNKKKFRAKRALLTLGSPVFVETAVFVDRDLFQHMRANFPTDTERELVRFVLAMINAVQLLYHDPSLGRPVNFVLKRLEILHEEPSGLSRPHDIDRFLSSFCSWQRLRNPPGDQDPQHWDHALILTGLDLYVVGKRGKVSSQVVGLAPVAGMCTMTSSCTVNEGRHFESVYVVAHEIGHNLGMRHDGPLADNDCDPSSYIMSPTLGSGKITWSACSRRYLQKFLETSQSRCLLDHGSSAGQLDHSAEGALPGERFDADQQCMLKYGRGSKHSLQQPLDDVCRDLHCQRERYTWTSHPALEGTTCGHQQWCRGGRCVARGLSASYTSGTSSSGRSGAVIAAPGSASLTGSIDGGWSEWRPSSDCASGCLYGEEGRLRAGSTGIMVSTRRCNRPRPEGSGRPCQGSDRRFQACSASQCLNVPRMTVREFAVQICGRAKEVDNDLTGAGVQRTSSDPEEACMVWCLKRNGDTKNRGWTFPDGTVCQTRRQKFGRQSYCINGRCEDFECLRSDTIDLVHVQHPDLCPIDSLDSENELSWRGNSKQRRRDSGTHWVPASGCHFNCMAPGTGVRLVVSKTDKRKSSIQLCTPDKMGCGRVKSPYQHATTVCSKYKERVRRLSGLGMQISAAIEDPDRPCRVACQDENVSHRFYLVNGEDGWFPFGTDCARGVSEKKAYCISGKCLEFGPDETPLSENEFTLPLLSRSRRSLETNKTRVLATLQQQDLDLLISKLNASLSGPINSGNLPQPNSESYDIDLSNPIFVEMNPQPYEMQPYIFYRQNELRSSDKSNCSTAK